MSTGNDPYTGRELQAVILRVDEKIDRLREDIIRSNDYTERRFAQVDKEMVIINQELKKLQTFQTRAMTIWAIVVFAATFIINAVSKFTF